MASIKKMSSPNCMGIYNSHPTISRTVNLIKLDNRAEVTLQYLVKVLPTTNHAAHVFSHALNDNVTHYWNVAFLIIHLSNGFDYIIKTLQQIISFQSSIEWTYSLIRISYIRINLIIKMLNNNLFQFRKKLYPFTKG